MKAKANGIGCYGVAGVICLALVITLFIRYKRLDWPGVIVALFCLGMAYHWRRTRN